MLRPYKTSGDLIAGISNSLEGLGVIFPFPFIAYQGWIGGIVSMEWIACITVDWQSQRKLRII